MEVKKIEREVKGKFLLLDILYRISKGETPYDIQKRYGWKRQRLNYWINRLKKANLIRLATRSNIAIYELTSEGKNYYSEYIDKLSNGIRLHNVSYCYPVLKLGNLPSDKQWQLQGILNQLKRDHGCSIVWNYKTLTISLGSIVGANAFEMMDKAKNIANGVAQNLRTQYNFELGEGYLARKPHFAIIHPLIDKISKHIEFTSDDAKIDESEGTGEIEFFEPSKVQNFIEMPEKIMKLEQHLNKQTEIMDNFARNLDLHIKVLNEIKQYFERLNKQ